MNRIKRKILDLISIVTSRRYADKVGVAMSNKNRIAALTVIAFCLAAVQGTASATIIQVDENLDNNLVPSGFSLTTTNNSGLANGRLEATAVNGSAALVYNALPADLSQIDISYRGHFGYSYWGTYTEVSIGGFPITMIHGVNPYKHPDKNFAGITGEGTITSPFNFSDFDYAITVLDGQVNYTGTYYNGTNNIQAFNLTHVDARILLADINQISFRSHNTTGWSEPVWLDDINMQFHTVPAPATAWLLGAGLLGWIRSGKRKARIVTLPIATDDRDTNPS